ncbi:TonB-dependent receptor [Seongchinamella unica]|uniref:TonB-dependent receptor n=1 Tax=Seongchinamella unica TaxID=2547392 RepID=A0A4R5LWY3_9GAMM|nr:TonB-dependent receptor [Seongchinamella unica]TDG15961.1 TonB-dependent receptor [Seongchinamella unica]
MNTMLRRGALAASMLAVASAGSAQPGILEEVVVVAQKRQENLQDVPISITALTGRDVRVLGLSKNVDIAAQTPGLMFAEGSEQLISISSIRGVSQNDVSFHQEPPNAVYMDGAYISVLSASNFQMFDLERVEVLRGPQGTLFGRNATGGLMHFISRKPTAEAGGYADLQVGDHSQVRFEGAINGSLTDGISGRLAVLDESYDGYADNLTTGKDFRGRDETGVRGQLLFEPTDDLDIRLIGFYAEQDTDLGFKHSANGFDEDGLMFTLPRELNFWGRCPGCDPSGHRDRSADPFKSDFDTEGFFSSETTNFTALVDWDFNGMSLASVTQYMDYEASHLEDGELSPRPGFDLNSGQDTDHFSQEFRLSGISGSMNWVAGIYFLERDASASQDIDVSLAYFDDVLSTFGAIPPGFIAGLGTTDNMLSHWSMDTSATAVFGQLDFDLGDTWTLVTGLRYTRDELDYRFRSTESIDGFPLGPGGLLGETEASDSKSDDDWSGNITLEWRPMENWMTYAKLSRGNKSGGWNAPFLGGVVTDFDSETLDAGEIGVKSLLMDGRARFNAAAFVYDYQDYQGFTFVDFAAQVSNLDAEVTGLEAEFSISPGAGWDISLGLSLLDAQIKDVVLPAGRVTDRDMPLAPDTSFNAMVRKGWDVLGGELAVMLDYVWVDDFYSETLNNPSGLIESYDVSNARVSFRTGNERWEFGLIVRNLTDEEILVYRTPIDVGFNQDHYARPRWVSGQVTYFWN